MKLKVREPLLETVGRGKISCFTPGKLELDWGTPNFFWYFSLKYFSKNASMIELELTFSATVAVVVTDVWVGYTC